VQAPKIESMHRRAGDGRSFGPAALGGSRRDPRARRV